jgi:hypothetical protein
MQRENFQIFQKRVTLRIISHVSRRGKTSPDGAGGADGDLWRSSAWLIGKNGVSLATKRRQSYSL